METALFLKLSGRLLSYPCGRGLGFSGISVPFWAFLQVEPPKNSECSECLWNFQDSETVQVLWGFDAFKGSEPSNPVVEFPNVPTHTKLLLPILLLFISFTCYS